MDGRAKTEHESNAAKHQRPIHHRHVDLTDDAFGGVIDFQTRDIAELDGLHGEGKGAADNRLRGNDRGGGCENHHGVKRPRRCHAKKRIRSGVWFDQHKRALTEVIQRQSRKDDDKPRKPNRFGPKVTDIGVKRLTAGDRQENGTQNHKTAPTVVHEELEPVIRIDCGKDFRRATDLANSKGADRHKPHDGDRAENFADSCRAV